MLVDGDPPDPTTPEQIAADMNLPVEAVREAIAYCEADPPEVREDHAGEEARLKATGMMDENGNYTGQYKILPPEERARRDYEPLPGRHGESAPGAALAGRDTMFSCRWTPE